ncbi:MAG: hypothetical protein SOV71_03305, partial [Anaerovoracaceae bacterium]|nr:hypothetical protein [Bacillota bacterium]MDY2670563.1 hypothetical protein [Anaerovoracaceae bacterium]
CHFPFFLSCSFCILHSHDPEKIVLASPDYFIGVRAAFECTCYLPFTVILLLQSLRSGLVRGRQLRCSRGSRISKNKKAHSRAALSFCLYQLSHASKAMAYQSLYQVKKTQAGKSAFPTRAVNLSSNQKFCQN